jgi:hypothetical protein
MPVQADRDSLPPSIFIERYVDKGSILIDIKETKESINAELSKCEVVLEYYGIPKTK